MLISDITKSFTRTCSYPVLLIEGAEVMLESNFGVRVSTHKFSIRALQHFNYTHHGSKSENDPYDGQARFRGKDWL